MKSIKPSQIKEAIKLEAIRMSKKKAIYEQAKKLNAEAKQLNESPFQGLGPGFVNSESPSNVIGVMTNKPQLEDGDDLNKVGSFQDLYNLDTEMQDSECNTEEKEVSEIEKTINDLRSKLDALEAKAK